MTEERAVKHDAGVHEMKRSAQRAEGEIVSARDRGENRPALH